MSTDFSPTLLTAAQSREADREAIANGIARYTLMQRAGEHVADFIIRHYYPAPTLILCGAGNNGGDGWVVARLLKQKAWDVRACLFGTAKDVTGDAALALGDWKEAGGTAEPFMPSLLSGRALVIDAIFGTGLARKIERDVGLAIDTVHASGLPVVAVDIPTGINADTGEIMKTAMRASHTITFSRAKPGHFLLPGKLYVGELSVVDIGIPDRILETPPIAASLNTPTLWRHELPVRTIQDHKYLRGYTVIAGGGLDSTGAAKLAALASQRSGAGAVAIACDSTSLFTYAAALMSIMTKRCDNAGHFGTLLSDPRVSAVLIGPGHGIGPRTCDFTEVALATRKPCVLDADVFTSFAEKPKELFSRLHEHCVLTPHEGEFSRLFSASGNKLDRAREAACTLGCTVVLKGSDTIIAMPDGSCVINANAPSSLATAGSGDVLAGIITGLMAQGMSASSAACAGVWLHGDAASSLPPYGLIAEDIIAALPKTLLAAHGSATA